MQVQLNDTVHQLDEGMTLDQALNQWDYANTTFAVALNGTFIPKSQYAHTQLESGDAIDIVTPMQGG